MLEVSDKSEIPTAGFPVKEASPPLLRVNWAMASVLLMLVLAILDSSALQVALPQMMKSLSVSAAESIWILISFQIALVAFLLPCSALADCFGYRRIFLFGGVIFVSASLFCALSQNMVEILSARAMQGLGAAAIYSTNPSLVRLLFPGEKLKKGIALSSMINAMSLALGPLAGTTMLSLGSWHLIFLINLPLGVVSLLIGYLNLPSERYQNLVPARLSLDGVSLILSVLFLPLIVIGCDRIPFDKPMAVELLIVGAIVGVLLFLRQSRRDHKIIPIHLFSQPVFSLSLACSAFGFLALTATYTALPFVFIYRHSSTMDDVAAYMILPPLMTAIGNGVVVILLRYLSEIHLCSLGMMSMALGLLGLAVGPFEGLILIVSLSLIGFGFGVFQTPNNRMILGAAPPDRSGNVSGTLAVTRTVGQAGGSSTVSLCLGLWGAVNGGSSALCIAALMAFICGLLGLLRIQRRVS